MMPRTTGLVASLEIGRMAPVTPARSQKSPVVRPDPNRAAGAYASGNGRRSDGLHRLDRKRRPVIEAGRHQGNAEHEKEPERFHLHDRDVGHDEGNQGADVAEGPGPLHLIVEVLCFSCADHLSGSQLIFLNGQFLNPTVRWH